MISYEDEINTKVLALKNKKCIRILSLETSCDETASAVIENGNKIISNVVYSQIDLHSLYGGVVPEIASRAHVKSCNRVIAQALEQANMTFDDIDALAVTYGPGLVGALLTGVSCMKALSYAKRLPLIPVNHIHGHVCANFLVDNAPKLPFICLIASGGHSHIVEVNGNGDYVILGRTVDDAAGEAIDKAARVLGLKYPGGPLLSKLAENGDPESLKLPTPKVEGEYNFSFSGLKTAFVNACHKLEQKNEEIPRKDFAASFEEKITDILADKLIKAALNNNIKSICLAGGVSANTRLRNKVNILANIHNLDVYMPPTALCTDNGAMIGSAAYFALKRGEIAHLTLNAIPNLKL